MHLSNREKDRYQKHILLSEIGEQGQLKLKAARVLVIGAGGLGCPVLLYLVSAGVGNIGIVDDDVVSLSNLQRQVLYSTDTIGKHKADVAKEKLLAMNPEVQITTYTLRFSLKNAPDILKDYDLVMDCTDNLYTRYAINDSCIRADKPFIYGSIHRFEGQVALFNWRDKTGTKGASYRCLFPEAGEAPNCSEVGVIGVLPGIIGTYQAMEAIKVITGIGQPLSGKLLVVDTLYNTQRVIRINRNETIIEAVLKEKPELITEAAKTPVQSSGVQQITSRELRKLLANKADLYLIDVREGLHDEGIAYSHSTAIPYSHLAAYVDELMEENKVVVYCQSGRTSAMAATLLIDYGLPEVYNLVGGLNEWEKEKNKEVI
ncbi:HesA/MoeB/ThiF family protein [Rhodocytophaga aerolata]|uniref:HesA/MoeB/ThiF family protein n=1 Tax=Rhodocytophaga aerolata TaxID=455078 RepID=A0ABT8R5W7_9BACT|nr:HesA/MoeB/ThiF family protein [Rhodocytophaga aerolata]MDO1447496.1 HesA/MoeB/ThiF family protein [Rhodocytophaga aerolata]